MKHLLRTSLFLLLVSCGPKNRPTPISSDIATTLEMARSRPTPERATVRVTVKVKSDPLGVAGSTGGGLVVDRPGRLFLEVFGPLGSSLVKVASDGTGLSVLLPKDERQLLAPSAEEALREISGGAIGLDDLAGLLVGDLPFDAAELKATHVLEDGRHQAELVAPGGIQVVADLEPAIGTPIHVVARDQDGVTMVEANFGPFEADESGMLWPTEVEVLLPAVELTSSLRYKTWKPVDEAPPVFDLTAPEGFTTEDLEEALRGLAPPPAE
ncbi:MAG: hypothetical protein EP330_30900 [Deltaproteobacteria bacterium]|nr:MAG: hypothetical protein EP330_30900 [Deltaproteobacteria bacterium]